MAQHSGHVDKGAPRHDEKQRREQNANDETTRGKVAELDATVAAALDTTLELEAAAQALYKRLDALMQNDDGKRLALDEKTVRAFAHINSRQRIAIHTITVRKQFLSRIHNSLQNELDEDVLVGFEPSEAQKKKVAELSVLGTKALKAVNEQRTWLETKLAELSPHLHISTAPTLEEAIGLLETDLFLKQIAEYNAGADAALEESWTDFWEVGHTATLERVELDVKQKLAYERSQNKLAEQENQRILADVRAEITKMNNDMEIEIKRRTADERERLSTERIEYENKLAEIERHERQSEADRYADDARAKIEHDKTKDDADFLKKKALGVCPSNST